jgi:lipopolysaccharide/colanic/teichoic acid biosynthesis glycosyltransferase
MVLALWLRQLPTKFRARSKRDQSAGTIQNAERFRYEIAREKMRTDRNGSPLAILMIELPAGRATAGDFAHLQRVLEERLRITDTVGVVSARCVGVLLPDTSKCGAWKVASDVCSAYPVGHDRPNCEVYVYPEEGDARSDGVEVRGAQQAASAAQREMNSLFVHRTPFSKRMLDVFGSSIGLVLTSPLFVLIGVAIKLTSRGPTVYTQEREGLGGRRFLIYKFRTMRLDADQQQATLRSYSEQDGPAFKMSRDPRTTWLGRWLRRTSLDELPQLWNVMRGEMSLVGPRPLPTAESLQCLPWQRQRLCVLPGMTCIWQIRGRNTVPFEQWMRMDLQYVRRRSLTYDLRLILTTAPALLLSRGPR